MILSSMFKYILCFFIPFQILLTVQRVLLAVSHSLNLIIYCVSSKKFRNVLKEKIFCCQRWAQQQEADNHQPLTDGMPLVSFVSTSKLAVPAASKQNSPNLSSCAVAKTCQYSNSKRVSDRRSVDCRFDTLSSKLQIS